MGCDSEVSDTLISSSTFHCGDITSFAGSTLSGTIQSVGYPSSYSHNIDCTYTIEERPDWHTVIRLEDLDTEPQKDQLTITHYPTAAHAMELAKLVE